MGGARELAAWALPVSLDQARLPYGGTEVPYSQRTAPHRRASSQCGCASKCELVVAERQAQHSTAQRSTAQHSTAHRAELSNTLEMDILPGCCCDGLHSTAQHLAAQHKSTVPQSFTVTANTASESNNFVNSRCLQSFVTIWTGTTRCKL